MRTLLDELNATGKLVKGTLVSSRLLKQMEVFGFAEDAEFDTEDEINFLQKDLVNLDGSFRVVCLDYMFEPRYGSEADAPGVAKKVVTPIFQQVEVEKESHKLPLEDIYVLDFSANPFYTKKVRKKKKPVNEYSFNKANLPENVKLEDRSCYYYTQKGDLLFYDRSGAIKGVESRILAVCRYLCPGTGSMNIGLYGLDELFTNQKAIE